MHVIVLTLYGLILWLSAMAYAIITTDVSVTAVALAGPFIISSAVVVLVSLDAFIWSVCSVGRRWLRARKVSSNG
jgi:hypothetical protein